MTGNKVVKFQIRHALLFLGIFLFILVAFVILIVTQNEQYMKYDEVTLQKYFNEFKTQINNKFFSIESRLQQIRISAEADLLESRRNGIKLPFFYEYVKDNGKENYFHMDAISDDLKKETNINITGNGSVKGRSRKFYRIMRMGMNLYDDFKAFRKTFPNLIYIYYTSKEKFIVHHPWFASKEYRFGESLFNYELWKLSLPEKNPERKIYWTDAYIDDSGEGGGIMTTCAVPIYDKDSFAGLVGADLTVDFLNGIVARFEPQRNGCMVIFDKDQNLMAHPKSISFKDKKILKLKAGLPLELASDLNSIIAAPQNKIIETAKWNYIKASFSHSPYFILYYYPRQTQLGAILKRAGYGTLAFILCMLILVSWSLYITHQKLIHPTEKFVNFILDKSNGRKVVPDGNMPAMWKPWFSTINKVFDENAELTENIKNNNKELTRANVSLQNEIEARNKAETEKINLERQLVQAEKTKAIGLLAGGVAHDFNNQLAIIIGYASILLQKKNLDKEKYRKGLESILASAKNSAELTKQLLAFAQKGNYQNIPVNIHMVVKEVISILKRTIDKRISIKESLKADLRTLKGDPAQLQNVIMNIAINAKHAMPNGGMLTFRSTNIFFNETDCLKPEFDLKPGNYIKISISDTGIGMDEETQKHIFEPFFTTNNSGNGTGLGLAAAHGTVKKHHGCISVESSPEQGATFNIFLPVIEKNLTLKSSLVRKELKENKGGARLLLVDDESEFCRMMTDFLGSLGYEVKTFNNPLKAIEHYRVSWDKFDLVAVDMMMPKFNGRDLINELEKINSKIKIIIASGFALEKDVQDLLRNDKHIAAFFKKPFDLVDFADKISSLINEQNV